MNAMNQSIVMPAVAAGRPFEESLPVILSFAPNWPMRTVIFQVSGTALVLSAAAMWVLPGSQTGGDMVLLKLGMSLFFFFCGLAMLMMHHADNRPDAYFDPIRGEVRVLQKNNRGRPHTVLRRTYETLGCAAFSNHSVELYDVDGSLLMRLPIEDVEVRQALRMQLSGRVRITTA